MVPETRPEHAWLRRLVGTWAYEGSAPAPYAGIETVRPLGELWILAECVGTMPGGGPAHTLTTLGFDPARGRFVGTWVGSMMTHLWICEGTLDAAGSVLTLEAEGPDLTGGGGTARYRDVITLDGPDRRTLVGLILAADGTWRELMAQRYRRTA